MSWQPAQWTAFRLLVPLVFSSVLRLGSTPREHMNALLLSAEFHPRLGPLVCESDDFVSAPFFWNAQVSYNHHHRPLHLSNLASRQPQEATPC